MEAKRRLAAVLAADVAGSGWHPGDDKRAAHDTRDAYRAVFREHIDRHDGRAVDTGGGRVLAVFDSALACVRCAVEVQAELARRNADLPETRRLRFRIGVNAGDVIERDDGTLHGDGANIAARLEELSEPGGITVSEDICRQLAGKLEYTFADLGQLDVSYSAKPVRACRLLADGPEVSGPRPAGAGRGGRIGFVAVAAAVALVGAGIAVWQFTEQSPPAPLPDAAGRLEHPAFALPTGPKIIVLPFETSDDDTGRDLFGDGLTEDITADLTRVRGLFVIGPDTAFKYRGRAVGADDLRQAIGVDYVVSGRFGRAADRLKIDVQLVDATASEPLWAETFDRDPTPQDLVDVEDDITAAIVSAIARTHGAIARRDTGIAVRAAPEALAAYECVLRFRRYLRRAREPATHAAVRDCLESAVAADPNYATAWAALSWVYLDEYRHAFNPRPNRLRRASKAAKRAVELDPSDGNPHLAMAVIKFFSEDEDAFRTAVRRALELSPNDTWLLGTAAEHLSLVGERALGLALIEKAARLNPHHPRWYHWPMWRYHFVEGNHDLALRHATDLGQPGFYWWHAVVAATLAHLDRIEDARDAVREARRLRPDLADVAVAQLRVFNYSDDAEVVVDRLIDGLGKAGLFDQPTP